MSDRSPYYRDFNGRPHYADLEDDNINQLQQMEQRIAVSNSQRQRQRRQRRRLNNNHPAIDDDDIPVQQGSFVDRLTDLVHQHLYVRIVVDDAVRYVYEHPEDYDGDDTRILIRIRDIVRDTVPEFTWSLRHHVYAEQLLNNRIEILRQEDAAEAEDTSSSSSSSSSSSNSSSSVEFVGGIHPQVLHEEDNNMPPEEDQVPEADVVHHQGGEGQEQIVVGNANDEEDHLSHFSHSSSLSASRSSDNMSPEIPESEMSNVDHLEDAESVIQSENDHDDSDEDDSAITWRNEEDISIGPSGSSLSDHQPFLSGDEADNEEGSNGSEDVNDDDNENENANEDNENDGHEDDASAVPSVLSTEY